MKPGRNEPCPCGSGKKYKKCCEPADNARREAELAEEQARREAAAAEQAEHDEADAKKKADAKSAEAGGPARPGRPGAPGSGGTAPHLRRGMLPRRKG